MQLNPLRITKISFILSTKTFLASLCSTIDRRVARSSPLFALLTSAWFACPLAGTPPPLKTAMNISQSRRGKAVSSSLPFLPEFVGGEYQSVLHGIFRYSPFKNPKLESCVLFYICDVWFPLIFWRTNERQRNGNDSSRGFESEIHGRNKKQCISGRCQKETRGVRIFSALRGRSYAISSLKIKIFETQSM